MKSLPLLPCCQWLIRSHVLWLDAVTCLINALSRTGLSTSRTCSLCERAAMQLLWMAYEWYPGSPMCVSFFPSIVEFLWESFLHAEQRLWRPGHMLSGEGLVYWGCSLVYSFFWDLILNDTIFGTMVWEFYTKRSSFFCFCWFLFLEDIHESLVF